jgi:hypothetical protein
MKDKGIGENGGERIEGNVEEKNCREGRRY